MDFVQLTAADTWPKKQVPGPVQTQVEVEKGQCLRIICEFLRVDAAVHSGQTVESHLVGWVQGQRPAERAESRANAAHPKIAVATQRVLEDAQRRHDVPGVEAEECDRRQQRQARKNGYALAAWPQGNEIKSDR